MIFAKTERFASTRSIRRPFRVAAQIQLLQAFALHVLRPYRARLAKATEEITRERRDR
jgi:hypothetical protein